MLVLTRKQNEKIRIGDSITITVLRMKGKAVRLGIEAPHELSVIRGELCFEPEEEATAKEPAPPADSTRAAVPPKSKPLVTGNRNAVASESTSHWPVDTQASSNDCQVMHFTVPSGTSPMRAMIDSRG